MPEIGVLDICSASYTRSCWLKPEVFSHNGEIVSATHPHSGPSTTVQQNNQKWSKKSNKWQHLDGSCTNICFLQLNISFNDKTEVFEYPSFEPVSPMQTPDEEPEVSARLKSNTPVGSSGLPQKHHNIIIIIRICEAQMDFSWLLSTPPLKCMSQWEPLPPALPCRFLSPKQSNLHCGGKSPWG